MLIWIAVANAVLWSAVITGLLLFLARNGQVIAAQAARLEARLSETPRADTGRESSSI